MSVFPALSPRTLAFLLAAAPALVLPGATTGQQTADKDKHFPPELVHFVPAGKNPVFTGGGPGAWDEKIRERGWVTRDGGLWKLWYTGYTPDRTTMKLGYATSPDGVRWRRHPNNPIYDGHWTEDVTVIQHEGRYYLFAEGLGDRAHLLVSDNGVAWTRVGPLDVRLKNGRPIPEGPYGTPAVLVKDGVWHLFYERGDRGIWLATSKDRQVWTNVQDEPVLSPGPGAYDRDLIALNQVVPYKGRYYACYHGTAKAGPDANKWCTCLAVSDDLLHWDKYPGNPLLPVAQNKSSGVLVHDGERFRLYTMHPEVNLHFSAGRP